MKKSEIKNFDEITDEERFTIIETILGRKLGHKEKGPEQVRYSRMFQKLREMDTIRNRARPGERPLKGKPAPKPAMDLRPRLPERPAGGE